MNDATATLTGLPAAYAMALLTLLLSENTALSMGASFLLVLFAVVLLGPVILLSRPQSSLKSKLVALALAFVPVWLGSGLNDDFAYMKYAWLVPFFSYLPLGVAFVNMARKTPQEKEKERTN